ncbi:MAG: hypothetical protein ABFS03_05415 [Chloroflexota bacterium]
MRTKNIHLNDCAARGHQSVLERKYIEIHLARLGHTLESVKTLPIADAKRLMTEACRYASLKMAEIEAKGQFRDRIRYE